MMDKETWKNWQFVCTRYRDVRDGKLYEIFGLWPDWQLHADHYWHEISEEGISKGEHHGPFRESSEAELDLWSR